MLIGATETCTKNTCCSCDNSVVILLHITPLSVAGYSMFHCRFVGVEKSSTLLKLASAIRHNFKANMKTHFTSSSSSLITGDRRYKWLNIW